MPNMSNKNFPHAHGAGRVIAAFSLSHPGSTRGLGSFDWLPGAGDMQVLPPRFTDPSLAATYPYPEPNVVPGTGSSWSPFRQPYNATSLGVFVTGSGTRSLPYRDALGLEVPEFLSAPLHSSWPSNGIYPYELVDETRIGSTHGQVVCSVINNDDLEEVGEIAYYEVGLNWELPPLRAVIAPTGGGSPEFVAKNFENRAIASYQRALERTFWVTASLSVDALSECHPQLEWGPSPTFRNMTEGPFQGMMSAIGTPEGYAAPYSGMFGADVLTPSDFSVWTPSDDEGFVQRASVIQSQVSAIPTAFSIVQDAVAQTVTWEIRAAPIVRVWCLVPVRPGSEPSPQDPRLMAPRPLPRSGLTPYIPGTDDVDTDMPPAINVQVIQKNSSAVDGTDGPIYDLYEGWADLGEPASESRRSRPRPSLSKRITLGPAPKDHS